MGKEFTCNAGDWGSIPGSGRSFGEGNGNPLQYSCLGNRMDRGAWWAIVHGVTRVKHDLATKYYQAQERPQVNSEASNFSDRKEMVSWGGEIF